MWDQRQGLHRCMVRAPAADGRPVDYTGCRQLLPGSVAAVGDAIVVTAAANVGGLLPLLAPRLALSAACARPAGRYHIGCCCIHRAPASLGPYLLHCPGGASAPSLGPLQLPRGHRRVWRCLAGLEVKEPPCHCCCSRCCHFPRCLCDLPRPSAPLPAAPPASS